MRMCVDAGRGQLLPDNIFGKLHVHRLVYVCLRLLQEMRSGFIRSSFFFFFINGKFA